MKMLPGLMVAALSLALLQADAQTEVPKGFKKGTIVVADGSSFSGFIKDNIRSAAAVIFLTEGKKKSYDGAELNSVEIEGIKFLCIAGDFFQILSEGDLNFLQKSSNARGKVFYNGNESIVSNGTEGKPGDYFMYRTINKQLKLITRKNFDEVIKTSFENNTAAIDKAKTVNGDLSQLKEAVDIYNKRNTN